MRPLAATSLAGAVLALAGALAAQEPARDAEPTDKAGQALFQQVDPSVVAIQHERAGGSGFVVTEDGYILTNGHVVQESDAEDPLAVAKRITVVLYDDTKYPARVIGHCLDPDVALIKIEPRRPLVPIKFADSDVARTGQRCYAFGSPMGMKRTFTGGVLSAVERTDLETFTSILQTDAAINPGNSGGPLLDEHGHVLGINTYGFGSAQSMGFAIPIRVAMVLREHFLRHGRFVRAEVPTMVLEELYDDLARAFNVEGGVLVDHVVPGSEAERLGFAAGDVIVSVDGKPVAARTRAELLRFHWGLVTREVGAKVRFGVRRPSSTGTAEPRELEAELREDDPRPSGLDGDEERGAELPQLVYEELGLAVQRIVPLSRLRFNLPEAAGVLVTRVAPGLPAAKAALQPGDILVELEGGATPDLSAFKTGLAAQLRARRKAIRLSVARRKGTIRTALAPYYTLAGKRVAVVVPTKPLEWEGLVLQGLMEAGVEVLMVRVGAGEGMGNGKPAESGGSPAKPVEEARKLADLKVADVEGVLLLGGATTTEFESDAGLAPFLCEAVAAKRAVGAAGRASLALLKAEPCLRDRKVTTAEEAGQEAMALAPGYTGKALEVDGRLVTSSGAEKAVVRDFLHAFKRALGAP
ncbi:MAG: trypsin-like peptidase domain-containing protein [Planctomycetes bacterium]|nr:trypsin-like peptidase domain-containing protein [Planctomycetota bacterium]